jgi:hypothetical protein
MTTSLENFVITHPDVTLSHTEYGQHFYLGSKVNILSSPSQRLQSFVENEGSPYRFIIVGRLTSFKVVEDSVCGLLFLQLKLCSVLINLEYEFGLFLSVNLGQLQNPSIFAEIFEGQLSTLQKIEEEDGMNEKVHSQVRVCLWSFFNFFLSFLINIRNAVYSTHSGGRQKDT